MSSAFTLYYWPLPFRGHFIRYVLAHAGADWKAADMSDVARLKRLAPAEQPQPFMAPPILHDRDDDLWLSQLPAILAHLGRRFALWPGDAGRDAITLRLICDANDVLDEITRAGGAQMWDDGSWAEFVGARLPRWLQVFERTGRDHGLSDDAGTMLGTDTIGLADLAVSALWFTLLDKLPQLNAVCTREAPRVMALARRTAEVPAIAAMRAAADAEMGGVYCGGQIEKSLRAMVAANPGG